MSAAPQIEKLILDAVTQQSERSKQVKLGPSEVGACAYCVAHTMSQRTDTPAPSRGDEGFGYAAWVGTAAHYWMEHHIPNRIPHESFPERKVSVFDIEGYGTIGGTSDLYVPELATTFDWKFPGKWSHDKLRLELKQPGGTPSNAYRYQQQLYGQGFINEGLPVERCVIVFFPRHSNNVNDIVFWEEAFQPDMVQAAKQRVETIWEWVQAGELAEIPSDDDCFTCSTYGR